MSRYGVRSASIFILAAASVAAIGDQAQANVTMTFEGLCHTRAIMNARDSYEEAGFRVQSSAFAAWGMYNRNAASTAALFSVFEQDTTTLTSVDGQAFDLVSMDLSEAFRRSGYVPVTFVGHRSDGTTIEQSVMLDGRFGFETFEFEGFNNLTSVTWEQNEAYHQFDNITLLGARVVPIPGASALALVGLGVVGLVRRKRLA